jgi:hypothetical protein
MTQQGFCAWKDRSNLHKNLLLPNISFPKFLSVLDVSLSALFFADGIERGVKDVLKCTPFSRSSVYDKRTDENLFYIRSQILKDVTVMNIVLWDVTPCSLLEIYQRFGRTYCIHPHGNREGKFLQKIRDIAYQKTIFFEKYSRR